jgi:hypothetical protein
MTPHLTIFVSLFLGVYFDRFLDVNVGICEYLLQILFYLTQYYI